MGSLCSQHHSSPTWTLDNAPHSHSQPPSVPPLCAPRCTPGVPAVLRPQRPSLWELSTPHQGTTGGAFGLPPGPDPNASANHALKFATPVPGGGSFYDSQAPSAPGPPPAAPAPSGASAGATHITSQASSMSLGPSKAGGAQMTSLEHPVLTHSCSQVPALTAGCLVQGGRAVLCECMYQQVSTSLSPLCASLPRVLGLHTCKHSHPCLQFLRGTANPGESGRDTQVSALRCQRPRL